MTDHLVEVNRTADRVEIRVSGDIDLANADGLGDHINEAISNRSTTVDLDLSGVTYLDSAGLRVLSTLAGRLHRLQIHLRVIAPAGSAARHVIELTGMADYVHVRETGLPTEPGS